jgi:uncharacterized protein YkwD
MLRFQRSTPCNTDDSLAKAPAGPESLLARLSRPRAAAGRTRALTWRATMVLGGFSILGLGVLGCSQQNSAPAAPPSAAAPPPTAPLATTPAKAPAPKKEVPIQEQDAQFADKLVGVINEERQKAGKPALKLNPKLQAAARSRAELEAEQNPSNGGGQGARGKRGHKAAAKPAAAAVAAQAGYHAQMVEDLTTRAAGPVEAALRIYIGDKTHPYSQLALGDWSDIGAGIARDGGGIMFLSVFFATPATDLAPDTDASPPTTAPEPSKTDPSSKRSP